MQLNSKEALKKLKSMPTCSECELYGSCFEKPLCNELYNTIKQDLDKLEKLEKVIEILKNKQVHIVILLECIKANGSAKLYNGYVELYNACVEKPFRLTQEEYNLLKEVLGND